MRTPSLVPPTELLLGRAVIGCDPAEELRLVRSGPTPPTYSSLRTDRPPARSKCQK